MKLRDDVTRDMLANVIENFRTALHEYQNEAETAYAEDGQDDFNRDVATVFKLVEDMLDSRLSTLEDD